MSSANSIDSLLSLFSKERRAKGGWWALAGFSFQSSIYLTNFFHGLAKGGQSPEELARTELLSDIFIPSRDQYTLIQVKRTLDRPKMHAALREAYEIASLCQPDFLKKLDFKIACMKRLTTAHPRDFSAEEIGGQNAKTTVWQHILTCFEKEDAILEQPDPLDHLRDFLWHSGISDPASFIDDCLGLLLRLFENPGEEKISEIAYELNKKYQTSCEPKSKSRPRTGMLIRPSDLAIDRDAESDTGILFDRRPQLKDLRLKRIRERPALFSELVENFKNWWREINLADEINSIPSFWIDGRSGEGKSVFLLQLMEYIVNSPKAPVIHFLNSAEELPNWLENQRELQQNVEGSTFLPSIAVIDDLHFVKDADEWEEKVKNATFLLPPKVAILTCSPSTERETFQSRHAALFNIQTFSVPNLDQQEMQDFAAWYKERTGKEAGPVQDNTENRLLVVWMFELLQGQSLNSFAANFKRRLKNLEIFELARSILAINALELNAPASLINNLPDSQRDAFMALCEESQLHFEEFNSGTRGTEKGYRLSHPQINWQLYCAWTEPPATLAQNLGRHLAPSLIEYVKNQDWQSANEIIFNLSTTEKLNDGIAITSIRTYGTINQALKELYLKQYQKISENDCLPLLPRWLEISFRGIAQDLTPTPIKRALLAGKTVPLSDNLSASVGSWLWRLSEIQTDKMLAADLRETARKIILGRPNAGYALASIIGKSENIDAALELVREWIEKNPYEPNAYFTFASLLARYPEDHNISQSAIIWLEKNSRLPQTYQLFATLVAAQPENDEICLKARTWLEENPHHPQAQQLFAPLVTARPEDEEIAKAALKWLEEHPHHPQAQQLFAPLATAHPKNEEIAKAALKWLEGNTENPRSYELLKSLVAARTEDDEIRHIALKWLRENSHHPNAYQLLSPLASARSEDDEIWSFSLQWLQHNYQHPQVYWLLKTLLKTKTEDDEIRHIALKWLKENSHHPNAYQLLSPLASARSEDDKIWSFSLQWLQDNYQNPKVYFLLKTLIKTKPEDKTILQEGLQWVEINSQHSQVPALLATVVASRPQDQIILKTVRSWINANTNHKNLHVLLGTLVTRTNGAQEWLEKSDIILNDLALGPKIYLLSALLIGSNGERRYIETTLNLLENINNNKAKFSLLKPLGSCLVHNPQNAVDFLQNPSTNEHQNIVAKQIRWALGKFPDLTEGFLPLIDQIPQSCIGSILGGCITSNVSDEILAPTLESWLNENHRKTGYGAVLKTLKNHPNRWSAITEIGGLKTETYEDYKNIQ